MPRPEVSAKYGLPTTLHLESPISLGEYAPRLEKENAFRRKLEGNLALVYGEERAPQIFGNIHRMMESARGLIPEHTPKNEGQLFSQDNIILITFPHQLQRGAEPIQNHEKKKGTAEEWQGEPMLQTSRRFLTDHVKDAVDTVHELPFNLVDEEWADRGFSQKDRFVVHPPYGTWEDIAAIGDDGYNVMGDLVVGHIDKESPEFKAFLAGHPDYQNYFISWRPEQLDQEFNDTGLTVREQIKGVRRPRTHYWLTHFDTADGPKEVVTTFSKRQVDLNYEEPKVFEDVIKVAIENLKNNVNVFRFDAITYMTKQLGTECVNLQNNYVFLEMFKDIIKELNPNALIITETNVPHEENLSYFGDGKNGADAAYNFPLPGSVLADFENEEAKHLYTVIDKMGEVPNPDNNTWLNVLSTHDGIGLKGIQGIVPKEEIDRITQRVVENGGRVSYGEANGVKSVYELNSTFWSALNGHVDDFDTGLTRMKTAKRILNALPGIPGDYILQMLGAENYQEPFTEGNLPYSMPRDINEEKLNYDEVDAQLQDPESRMARIFNAMTDINRERKQYSALRPTAPIKTLPDLDPRVFAFTRGGANETNVLALNNLSSDAVAIEWGGTTYHLEPYDSSWTPVSPGNTSNGKEHQLYAA